MEDYILRTAEVVDDIDPDELSRVKVRILPEMKDVSDDLLPWAKPATHGYGTGADHGTHTPPEIGSFVVVRIANAWRTFHYTSDEYIEGFAIYSKWSDISSQLTSYGTDSYPQPRMLVGKDGTIRFHNTETGAIGVYHTTGTFVMINPDGQVRIKTDDAVMVEVGDKVQINNGTEKFVTYSQLYSTLDALLTTIINHWHADPLTGPLPLAPQLSSLKATLSTNFSEQLATMKNITSD